MDPLRAWIHQPTGLKADSTGTQGRRSYTRRTYLYMALDPVHAVLRIRFRDQRDTPLPDYFDRNASIKIIASRHANLTLPLFSFLLPNIFNPRECTRVTFSIRYLYPKPWFRIRCMRISMYKKLTTSFLIDVWYDIISASRKNQMIKS